MTEELKQAIRAFADWLKENNLSCMIVAVGEDHSSHLTIQGDEELLGAGLAGHIAENDEFRDIVARAVTVATVASLSKMLDKFKSDGQR